MTLIEAIKQAKERKELYSQDVHVYQESDGSYHTITDMNLKHFVPRNKLIHTEYFFKDGNKNKHTTN